MLYSSSSFFTSSAAITGIPISEFDFSDDRLDGLFKPPTPASESYIVTFPTGVAGAWNTPTSVPNFLTDLPGGRPTGPFITDSFFFDFFPSFYLNSFDLVLFNGDASTPLFS